LRTGKIENRRPERVDAYPSTWSMREMSHGRAPLCANSTIRCRVESGSGRPLTKRPPSWLTPLWPATFDQHVAVTYTPRLSWTAVDNIP